MEQDTRRRHSGGAITSEALIAPILILGAPRSGTTWLAKILDSHPDVLYRHEPDATLPGPSPLAPEALPPLLTRWAAETSARTVTKPPHFRKSWQPGWARWLRALLATMVRVAARMPPPMRMLADLRIPDLASRDAPHFVIKSTGWIKGAAILAKALPDSRTIFILRHPCGQVASVMRGDRQQRFDLKTKGTDMAFDEVRTIRFAAASGVVEAEFQALPDAAKYAWSWRAFNETTYVALGARPNVQVVLYETLCAEPDVLTRRILKFAGLSWNIQIANFLARSTSRRGKTGYYGVFRDAVAAAEAWRTSMPSADQKAVRLVISASPLTRFWPDLMSPD